MSKKVVPYFVNLKVRIFWLVKCVYLWQCAELRAIWEPPVVTDLVSVSLGVRKQ